MTDTCAHSKDFITVKQRTQAPPSEKMNFFPARSDMCPMVFSAILSKNLPSRTRCIPPGKNRKKDTCLFASALNLHIYGRGLPQLLQNFPLFTCPQLQVHSLEGAGFPHSLQNFPVFTCPQLQVQLPAVGCALFTGCCCGCASACCVAPICCCCCICCCIGG